MTAVPHSTPAALVNHPDTPCEAVESIETELRWERSGVLAITYRLTGAIERLRIPPFQSVRRADGLWGHTCFEAFLGAKNDAEYFEFNFSPSGEWAVYGFRDYRDGGPVDAEGFKPAISINRENRILELGAKLRLDQLPELQLDVCLWVGLSAAMEEIDGRLSYWALKHPAGKPDFHHPVNFILEIHSPVAQAGAIAYTAKP